MFQNQIDARLKSLQADVDAAYTQMVTGKLSSKAFDQVMDKAEAARDELLTQSETRSKALRYSSGADSAQQHGLNSFADRHVTKSMQAEVKNAFAASPLMSPDAEAGWRAAFKSLQAGQGFRFELKGPGFAANVRNKTGPDFAVEGSPGSLLEPVLLPQAFRQALEPTRIWSLLPGQEMTSQAVSYIRHTGNTNVAAVTAEAATLPDLGMTFTPYTADAVKIGCTAAASLELLNDYSSFMDFIPSEASRLVIDEESNYLINDPSAGFLATSGILTRSAASSPNPITAIEAAKADIRKGNSFATADLIIMSPDTWLDIRTTRISTGAYLLDQLQPNQSLGANEMDSLLGTKVVVSTKMPDTQALVLDTAMSTVAFQRQGLEVAVNWQGDSVFSTYGWQFRVVERIALAVVRPTAIALVTGLPAYSTGAS
jgi:HK97 family phage major capsid protein